MATATERGLPLPFILEVVPEGNANTSDEARRVVIESSVFDNQILLGSFAPVLALADWLLLAWAGAIVLFVVRLSLRRAPAGAAWLKFGVGLSASPFVLGLSLATGVDPSIGSLVAVGILALLTRDGLFSAGIALGAAIGLGVINPAWNPGSVPMLVTTIALLASAFVVVAFSMRIHLLRSAGQ